MPPVIGARVVDSLGLTNRQARCGLNSARDLDLMPPGDHTWTPFEAGWSPASSRAFSRKLSCTPGPLAHPEEQGTFNPKVPGSRPGRPTGNSLFRGINGLSTRLSAPGLLLNATVLGVMD